MFRLLVIRTFLVFDKTCTGWLRVLAVESQGQITLRIVGISIGVIAGKTSKVLLSVWNVLIHPYTLSRLNCFSGTGDQDRCS
jgi:hypothetical protein